MSNTVTLRPLHANDLATVSELHASVFGPGRFARTAYRVREQRAGASLQVSPFCQAAVLGNRLIASVTMTPIRIGIVSDCLLLGPLAVHPDFAGQGYGRGVVAAAIDAAKSAAIKTIILVGDEPYYARFGFKRVAAGQITFPGPVDQGRILGLELQDGALAAAKGLVVAG
jgi:predicted N-acetyltransferase YhbS